MKEPPLSSFPQSFLFKEHFCRDGWHGVIEMLCFARTMLGCKPSFRQLEDSCRSVVRACGRADGPTMPNQISYQASNQVIISKVYNKYHIMSSFMTRTSVSIYVKYNKIIKMRKILVDISRQAIIYSIKISLN